MIYLIILLVIVLLSLFILFYPFKVSLHNEDNYLFINISNFINLKINLFVLLEKIARQNLTKPKGSKVISKIKFKEIDIRLEGLNFDYRLNGSYYGLLYAIFGFLDSLMKSNDIEFNYYLRYDGDKSLDFKSVCKGRLGYIIKAFY